MLNQYDSHLIFPIFHKIPQVTYPAVPYRQHLQTGQLQSMKFKFSLLSLIQIHLRAFHYLINSSIYHHQVVMFDKHFLKEFIFRTHCINFQSQSHLTQLFQYRLNQFQWSLVDRFINLHIISQLALKFTSQGFWLHWCISLTYFWFSNFASCFNRQDQWNGVSDLMLVKCLCSNVWFLKVQFLFQKFLLSYRI